MLARLTTRIMDSQGFWTKPLGNLAYRFLHWFFGAMPAVRDLLIGRWLGHPLHAVLTDAPIGILFLVIVFDVLGPGFEEAAEWTLGVGILAMLGAALAGFADYADTDGKARERATLHSTLMLLALVGYVISFVLRLPTRRQFALRHHQFRAGLAVDRELPDRRRRRVRRRRHRVRPRQHGQPTRVPRRRHEVAHPGAGRDGRRRHHPRGPARQGQARRSTSWSSSARARRSWLSTTPARMPAARSPKAS